MDKEFDLIIIGSGPAGMAAAIYGSRAGLKCAMIESEAPGGKLVKTYEIANYPGIKEINGAELAMQMYEHSTAFSCESLFHTVTKVEDGEVKDEMKDEVSDEINGEDKNEDNNEVNYSENDVISYFEDKENEG